MSACTIREATPEDIPFIYSCWLNSYKHDSILGLSTSKSIFFSEYRQVIDTILNRTNTKVLVACKDDEPNVIFGYLVHEPNLLHYVFIKESFRNLGIAKALYNRADMGAGSVLITHRTNHIDKLMRTHPDLIYNPFLLFNKE